MKIACSVPLLDGFFPIAIAIIIRMINISVGWSYCPLAYGCLAITCPRSKSVSWKSLVIKNLFQTVGGMKVRTVMKSKAESTRLAVDKTSDDRVERYLPQRCSHTVL